MKVEIEQLGADTRRFDILATWDRVADDYETVVANYKNLPLKGFRGGKVPIQVINKVYKSNITDDLLYAVTDRILKEAEIEGFALIELKDGEYKYAESLYISGIVYDMPKFELCDYKNLSLNVDDEEMIVEEISEKLLKLHTFDIAQPLIEREEMYDEEDEQVPAADRVKLMLILKAIANREELKVEEVDIDERLKEIAEDEEIEVDDLRDYLMQNNGMPKIIDGLIAELAINKIIDLNIPESTEE